MKAGCDIPIQDLPNCA